MKAKVEEGGVTKCVAGDTRKAPLLSRLPQSVRPDPISVLQKSGYQHVLENNESCR